MSWSPIGRKLRSSQARSYAAAENGTMPTLNITQLPDTILESFIPGYSFLSHFILDAFGFDVSIAVSVVLIAFAFTTAFQYVYKRAKATFLEYFTASVSIDSHDDFYYYFTGWVSKVEALQNVRALRIKSDDNGSDGFPVDDDKIATDLADGELFNFSNWEAKIPPRFEPHTGSHWFWYKGNLFKFERRTDMKLKDSWLGSSIGTEESLTIQVLGRSAEPAKQLLMEARDMSLSKESTKTIVRRPSPKESRGRGRQAWMRVAMRPSRPMETVVLDAAQKTSILRDINEFVHPATPRWYANRGIPYRRGYLFHGPPGTGKTSLSFAIAGVFGLDIYCISLLEPTLTEEDLSILFNNLPPRCVVLLEDIDSAGLHRKDADTEDDGAKDEKKDEGKRKRGDKKEAEDTSTTIAKEVAKAFKNVNDQTARNANNRGGANNQGISLSGLLNAIDGVASPEGRVLVMTTNFPEKLDEALVRPGRIDMKIAFTLATKQQIRELFLRMYTSDAAFSKRSKRMKVSDIVAEPLPIKSNTYADAQTASTAADDTASRPSTPNDSQKAASDQQQSHVSDHSLDHETLHKLAETFAIIVPEATFSPAEIQGFLLTRKKEPQRAVEEVGKWKEEVLESRKKGTEKTAVDPSIRAAMAKDTTETDGKKNVTAECDQSSDEKPNNDGKSQGSQNGVVANGSSTEDEFEVVNGETQINGSATSSQILTTNRDRRETVTKVNGEKSSKENMVADLGSDIGKGDNLSKEPDARSGSSEQNASKDSSSNGKMDNGHDSSKDKSQDDADDDKAEPYDLKESLFDGEDDKSENGDLKSHRSSSKPKTSFSTVSSGADDSE